MSPVPKNKKEECSRVVSERKSDRSVNRPSRPCGLLPVRARSRGEQRKKGPYRGKGLSGSRPSPALHGPYRHWYVARESNANYTYVNIHPCASSFLEGPSRSGKERGKREKEGSCVTSGGLSLSEFRSRAEDLVLA